MGDRPVLNLTNFASRKRHRGHVYTIMRRPRAWEHGAGRVDVLTPDAVYLDAVRSGAIGIDEYRRRFENWLSQRDLRHSVLTAHVPALDAEVMVHSGDTLCCACSREAASRGECHRTFAAQFLVRAGWRVVLDGVEVPDVG